MFVWISFENIASSPCIFEKDCRPGTNNNVWIASFALQRHVSNEEKVFKQVQSPPGAVMKVAEIASVEMKIAQTRDIMVLKNKLHFSESLYGYNVPVRFPMTIIVLLIMCKVRGLSPQVGVGM